MKRYIITAVAIQVSSLYALLGGVGINFGQDSYSISDTTYSAVESLPEFGDITRSETTTPFSLGGFAYLTAIPFIDIEAEVNASFSSYEYSYTGGDLPKLDPVTIPMFTYGGSVSVQKKIFKFPTIRLLAGAGISQRGYSKIITTDVLSGLDDSRLDANDSENIKYLKEVLEADKMATGYHLELRARFKPPIIPFSLNANMRYNFMQDFIQGVDNYLSVSAGLAFAI